MLNLLRQLHWTLLSKLSSSLVCILTSHQSVHLDFCTLKFFPICFRWLPFFSVCILRFFNIRKCPVVIVTKIQYQLGHPTGFIDLELSYQQFSCTVHYVFTLQLARLQGRYKQIDNSDGYRSVHQWKWKYYFCLMGIGCIGWKN